jgi:flagellar hook-associated protein 2
VAVAGQDAEIDLGGGTLIARSSNTISDVMEGVTLTLSKADAQTGGVFTGPPVTVSVKKDADGIASKVQALVDAANAARNDAKSLTAMDPVSKVKGRLYGDSMVRGLVDEVRSTIPGAQSKVAEAGVTVDRFGVITFDKAAFLKALEGDPAAVEAALGKDGLAGRMLTLGDAVSRGPAADGGPGRISNAITSRESQISSLKSNIESWDSRLAMKEKQLQRQYTSLEVALGKAQSQGAWLSGQLANLPKWSS